MSPFQCNPDSLDPFWEAIAVCGWQWGQTPNSRDAAGRTALMWALRHWQAAVAPLLLAGADVNAQSDAGGTAMMVARRWCPAYASVLKAHGARAPSDPERIWEDLKASGWTGDPTPTSRNRQDLSPLFHALQHQPSLVPDLISLGCKVEDRASHSWTCTTLMAAARWHPPSVPLLLELGVDVHARADDGTTALMLACEFGGTAVPALLRHGAVASDLNTNSESPLLLALSCQPTAVRPLLEAGATPADLRSKWIRGRLAEPYHPESLATLAEWGLQQALEPDQGPPRSAKVRL